MRQDLKSHNIEPGIPVCAYLAYLAKCSDHKRPGAKTIQAPCCEQVHCHGIQYLKTRVPNQASTHA
ncbi:hypothetical protein BS47DRAFT_1337276 [Hydnum rufescens UP504]|uniref:Uncharacterized protein n=1 Tax=Hydnum rufescens UP504 TaxID=1448309 RepID=A0A9P6B7Z1_9AGAM|nr:hypothetical protein BS47DRAFT_1337276 [Hydnum rufescens UP504]